MYMFYICRVRFTYLKGNDTKKLKKTLNLFSKITAYGDICLDANLALEVHLI